MGPENSRIHVFGPFRLEIAERRLLREGAVVALTVKQFDLLRALVEHAGHLRSREELVEQVWPNTIVEEHSLTSRVSALRKILGDEGDTPRYIETVRGRGYRFIAEVTHGASAADASPRKRARVPLVPLAVGAVLAAAALAWSLFAPPKPSPASSAPPRSIVVLPFANLSPNPDNTYFASGMQDMILTKLAGIADLRVIARASTLAEPSRIDDVQAVARQFGVANVLEGSVQREGERVLINVQLIDAASGAHLWAQTYSRPFDHILDIEVDVATRVAAALSAKLQPAEATRLANAPTSDPQAYDLFLQAEYPAIQAEQGRSNAQEAFERADVLYRAAIARDPAFALAKARLAFMTIHAAWFGSKSSKEFIAEAERLANEALQSDLPQGHLAMGYVRYWGHLDYAGALAEFEKAEQALPNDAAVKGAIAFIHRRQGRFGEAISGLEQAELLDPRNPLWFAERGNTLAQMRRYAEAEHEYSHAIAVDPDGYRVVAYKASAYLCAGELVEARKTLDGATRLTDSNGMLAVARFRQAWLERAPERALAALASIDDEWVEDSFVSSLPVSLLRGDAYALAGDSAAAHAAYESAAALLTRTMKEEPRKSYLSSSLGLALAGLGQKEAAIAAARLPTEQMPLAADLFGLPAYMKVLAETHARVGDAESATRILRRLLDAPAGRTISVQMLQIDPSWDRIRNDPAFQALLTSRRSDDIATDANALQNLHDDAAKP
jgi:TolB-like protein/DNA-binding winged helix-turn-helix (wHTH) protein/Flp pilus assembly protein TadD